MAFSFLDKQLIYIIAEFACIHEGERNYLIELAGSVLDAGANAVKFQVFDKVNV